MEAHLSFLVNLGESLRASSRMKKASRAHTVLSFDIPNTYSVLMYKEREGIKRDEENDATECRTNTSSSRRTKREWNPSRFRVKVNEAGKQTRLRFVRNRFRENRSGFRSVHLRYKRNVRVLQACTNMQDQWYRFIRDIHKSLRTLFSMSFERKNEWTQFCVSYLWSNDRICISIYISIQAQPRTMC